MAEITLTKAQQAAVQCRGGRILVSAAAGSGKTKVLVDRLMGYICDPRDPANVDDFLIITYTKAAASELRGKITAALTERLAMDPGNRHLAKQFSRIYLAKISTVHSFCSELLREYAYWLDISGDFRVADTAECEELRRRAMEKTLEDAYRAAETDETIQMFLDTLGAGRSDYRVPEIVAGAYDQVRCHVDPHAFLDYCRGTSRVSPEDSPERTPWGQYLMEDLRSFLAEQKDRMEELARQAEADESLAPKVAPMLWETAGTLEEMAAWDSWDQIYQAGAPDFGRMPAVKKPRDPELRDRIRDAKAACKKELEKKLRPFSACAAEVMTDLEQTGKVTLGIFRLVEEFEKAYDLEKKRRRILDFSDLEHLTIRLLLGKSGTTPTAAAKEIAARFREVMVDEYQDSNAVQDSIFSALTRERRNAFFVGDVKQSIYRFRLADPTIFLEKYQRFPTYEEARDGDDRKILLSENFRSGGGVLAAVNDVFACAMSRQVGGLDYGKDEALVEGLPHEPLGEPETELHCISYGNGAEYSKYEYEADFAAMRISELLDGTHFVRGKEGLRPIKPSDVVILLRSPGTSGRYYADALARQGIPCVTGAKGDVLQTAEIGVLLSILRAVDNPMQDIPLTAALGSPAFGFTAERLAELRASYRTGSIYHCLQQAAQAGARDAGNVLAILEGLGETAKRQTLAELIQEIFAQTHLESSFSAMEDGDKRLANLRFFYETAAGFEKDGRKSLPRFLKYLDTQKDRGLSPEESGAAGQAVSIMSIHKSKGLEFPVVILGNLSGKFNKEDLSEPVLSDSLLGVGCHVVEGNQRIRYPSVAHRAIARKLEKELLSEELRVLYVAMTRAKDRLIMLYTSKTLEKDLVELTRDMRLPRCDFLAERASCMGQWVLMQAITRTEAGALHALAGRPEQVTVRPYPWRIRVRTGEIHESAFHAEKTAKQTPIPDDLEQRLSYAYPNPEAAKAPSKLTATQMKGRTLDEEAASLAPRTGPRGRIRRALDLSGEKRLDPRQAGIATHLAMQFLRYEACGSKRDLAEEIERLQQKEFLTPQQAEEVNQEQILRFFRSGLGKRLMTGDNILREFKFSLLQEAGELTPALAGEKFLLQGVVDLCLTEPDGLTILDFKTDRVEKGKEQERGESYAPQVRTYGKALSRIFGLPVKALYLYFFQTDGLLEVSME